MKYDVVLLTLLLTAVTSAQVGIGTSDPDPATVLDIHSEIRPGMYGGLKLPNLSLNERNQIATPIPDGLIIYLSEGPTRCVQLYDATISDWVNLYCMNEAPVASGVAIDNYTGFISQTLTFDSSTYSQTDAEGDTSGTRIYQWYRSDDAAGSYEIPIPGATFEQYTLEVADHQKWIRLGVRPTATSGASPGVETYSPYTNQVDYAPTQVSLVPQSSIIAENVIPDDIILVFEFSYQSSTDIAVTVASSDYYRLDESSSVTVTIPANQTSPFSTTVFKLSDNTTVDGTTDLTFSISNVSGGLGNNLIGSVFQDTWQIIDDEGGFAGVAQDFDTATTWSFTPHPAIYTVGGDIWNTVASLSSITTLDGNFWGMRDLVNTNGGGGFLHSLSFDSIDISLGTNVKFSFDYESQGINAGGERYGYELIYDGVAQGQVDLCNACNTDIDATLIINIPNTVSNFGVIVYGYFNGDTDIAAFDNFRLYQ